jgi:hypothetical protein
MVDVKTQTQPIENPRKAIQERRNRRLRLIAGDQPKTVKVYAANETMLDVLRHGNGTRFRDDIGQAVEWPNDSFTKRRIADGSVRTDGPGSGEMAEPDETLNAREQAAARKPKEQGSKNGEPKAAAKPQPPQPPAA